MADPTPPSAQKRTTLIVITGLVIGAVIGLLIITDLDNPKGVTASFSARARQASLAHRQQALDARTRAAARKEH